MNQALRLALEHLDTAVESGEVGKSTALAMRFVISEVKRMSEALKDPPRQEKEDCDHRPGADLGNGITYCRKCTKRIIPEVTRWLTADELLGQ